MVSDIYITDFLHADTIKFRKAKLIVLECVCSKTVLVSHNIICFACFMPMRHGVNKKAITIVPPHPT